MLKGCFDGFADEDGAIPADNVGGILSMMGMKVKPSALKEIIEEIDEDGNSITQHNFILIHFESKGSGLLEFGEFCQLAAKFLVEEDDEALKKELKEAFRIYDKDQQGYITTGTHTHTHFIQKMFTKQHQTPVIMCNMQFVSSVS